MALVPFNEVVNFTRGTGATRINAAGLIVGVDFSSTSNTITTGSKTFTLTADANVNRDWSVGENVRAVDQVGGGVMMGTVTSYTPSTQALVINVTSITGSGTSTNWRIGSLEVRRDSNGVLVEGQISNIVPGSQNNPTTLRQYSVETGALTISANGGISPDGSNNAFVVNVTTAPAKFRFIYVSVNAVHTNSAYVKALASGLSAGIVRPNNTNATATVIPTDNFVRLFDSSQAGGAGTDAFNGIVFNNVGQYLIYGFQTEIGDNASSLIPTTTVSVTRAADSLTATATTLAALRQGEGTLVVTAQNPDNGISQKRALRLTGANGEIRIAKAGTGTTANFTKMAEGAGLRLMGTASSLLSNNGLESAAVSATFAETGVLTALGQSNAVTFNGTDTFGRVGSTEESVLDSLLTTRQMRGLGGTTINGAHWTGTSFIAGTAAAGRVLKTVDGISYRSINAPAITQPTTEVTSGLIGAINRVVIVGNGGFIATSDDDGETWTSRTSGTTNNLLGATFGNLAGANLYLVSGVGGQIRRSTDGVSYANGTGITAGNTYYDVHIANNIAVAVSDAGQVLTSTNGSAFTAATATNTTATLLGVTYSLSLNLWIAVGAGGTIITAANPAGTWTVQTSGTTQALSEVGIFNNAIYVVGAAQTLLTSTNGTTYTSLTAGVTGGLGGIAASPTTLLITGSGGAIASSTDGTTFTSRTNNNATLNGIAFGAGKFVSVGNAANGSGYIATIDADGTVTRRVSGVVGNITNIDFVNGLFIATLNAGSAITSTNGVDWTLRTFATFPANTSYGSAFGNGVYVVVLSAGRYATSTDGVSFNGALSNVTTQNLQGGVAFGNGIFIAVGVSGTIISSPNGTTWTLRTSGTTQNLTSVMYSQRDSRWYAAGNAGTLLFSEDNGVTWASVQNAGLGAITNSGSQVNALLGQWQTGTNKIAISYRANEVSVSINGSVPYVDNSATIPNVANIAFGNDFNGYITRVRHVAEVLNVQTESTL